MMLLAVWPLGSAIVAWAGEYHAEIGQRHGDFTLPDIRTGKPVSLSDFRGKKVLLIHFASW
jgi:hypothetical protein